MEDVTSFGIWNLESGELELALCGNSGCVSDLEDVRGDNSSQVFSHVIHIRNDRWAGFEDGKLAGLVVVRMCWFCLRLL